MCDIGHTFVNSSLASIWQGEYMNSYYGEETLGERQLQSNVTAVV